MSGVAYGATGVDMDDDGALDDKYAKAPRSCCVRYGNTHVLCASAGGRVFPFMCHVGPNWPCMLVTYAISLGPVFFFMCVFALVSLARIAAHVVLTLRMA